MKFIENLLKIIFEISIILEIYKFISLVNGMSWLLELCQIYKLVLIYDWSSQNLKFWNYKFIKLEYEFVQNFTCYINGKWFKSV